MKVNIAVVRCGDEWAIAGYSRWDESETLNAVNEWNLDADWDESKRRTTEVMTLEIPASPRKARQAKPVSETDE